MIQKTCQKCRNVFPGNKILHLDSHGDICPGCAEDVYKRGANPYGSPEGE